MKGTVIALLSILGGAAAWAQNVNAPAIKAGDTWTYRETTEKGVSGWNQSRDEVTISRVTASSIYYMLKPAGSTQPPRESISGLDWSRARDVNGKETIVNRPLYFPLTVGKSWQIEYTEQHPTKTHKSEQWNHKYTVVGFETVEVPAGQFNAVKVESEGHWTAELEPMQTVVQGAQSTADSTSMVTQAQRTRSEPVTGRTYKAFWYSPEVKRWVKAVEEYYSAGGVRNERYTQELESYKVSE
ncbi:MAG TPA: hypothetical protein VKT22_03725 [Steroidobacteraceae bacterium]|nr:hypothetical protein [Steroidobacteraceae bacterium]